MSQPKIFFLAFLAVASVGPARCGRFASCVSSTVHWLYNYGTPVLALTDATTDVLIAVEYYEEAEKKDEPQVFFTCAAVLLGLSSFCGWVYFVYIVAGTGRATSILDKVSEFFARCIKTESIAAFWTLCLYFAVMLPLLPLGQLLLVAAWLIEMLSTSELQLEVAPPHPPVNLLPPPPGASAAQVEEFKARYVVWMNTQYVPYHLARQEHFSRMVRHQINIHVPFFIEGLVESCPQSLLQVTEIVIKMQKGASALSIMELLSLGISLVSILSKAYVFCESKVKEVFWFKAACLGFDITCVYYTFASLWNAAPGDSFVFEVFFLQDPVDVFSAIYLYSVGITLLATYLFALWFGILQTCYSDSVDSDLPQSGLKRLLIQVAIGILSVVFFCVGAIVCTIPAVLLLMVAHVSYIVLWLKKLELSVESDFYMQAFVFVSAGADYEDRIRALNHALAKATSRRAQRGDRILLSNGLKGYVSQILCGMNVVATDTDKGWTMWKGWCVADCWHKDLECIHSHIATPGDWVEVEGQLGLVVDYGYKIELMDGTVLNNIINPLKVGRCRKSVFSATMLVVADIFRSNPFHTMAFVDTSDEENKSYLRKLRVVSILAFVLQIWCAFYGFIYPFLSFALELHHVLTAGRAFNPIRIGLFLLACIFFVVAVVIFINFAWRFTFFAWNIWICHSLEEGVLSSAQELYTRHYMKAETSMPMPSNTLLSSQLLGRSAELHWGEVCGFDGLVLGEGALSITRPLP